MTGSTALEGRRPSCCNTMAVHPSRLPRIESGVAPQRLCSLSSVLPWFLISDHGVEDGEDFAGDGDESDLLWFPAAAQVLIEQFECRIESAGGERGQEEGLSTAARPPPIMLLPFQRPD